MLLLFVSDTHLLACDASEACAENRCSDDAALENIFAKQKKFCKKTHKKKFTKNFAWAQND